MSTGPGTGTGTGAGAGCGCGCGSGGSAPGPCPCETPQDPRVATNAPCEPTISYRVDDFSGFRRALLEALAGEESLAGWHPTTGDLGLQLLEWWAVLGDILTFYNERIANESYLRTAQQAGSVSGLVDLLGYTPAPGLAATGLLGAVRSTRRMAEDLVLPAGMQVSSTATPGVPAQIFEVATQATFAGPSDVFATLPPLDVLPTTSTGQPASVLLAGKVTSVKAGDRLVLVASGWAGTDDDWALVGVASVLPETDPGTGSVNTRVSFAASTVWGTAQPPTTSEVGRLAMRSAVVGALAHENVGRMVLDKPSTGGRDRVGIGWVSGGWVRGWNQPPAPTVGPATGYRLLRPTAATSLWSTPAAGASPAAAVSSDGSTVNLASAARSIQPGDLVLFDGGTQAPTMLGFVSSTTEQLATVPFPEQLSPPAPDLVVTQTVLEVASADDLTTYNTAPGAVALRCALRDVGTVIANPVGTFDALPQVVFVPASFTPAVATTALLQDADGVGVIVELAPGSTVVELAPGSTVAEIPPGSAALTVRTAPGAASSFTAPLASPLHLLVDVVGVSRGVTVPNEVLGDGNNAVANQRFPLKKQPLTYLASGTSWTSSLHVFVDGIAWTEVPTLYGQSPSAQVYVVERAADQSATVRFGDGLTGARPSTGSGNITATYRYGSGAASPPAGRLTTVIKQQANLAGILNPVPVSGGIDPQAAADVKADAPASVFTFGRAISAIDYEVVAGQAAGVSRVRASWSFDADAQRMLVTVYVNDDLGGVATASAALAGASDPNRPVAVRAAQAIELSLGASLVVASDRVVDDVVSAAKTALSNQAGGAFGPARMGIGQWLYRSYVEVALSVAGVVAVHDLTVSWASGSLGNVADPGEGAYFDLPASNVGLTGGHDG